MVVQMKDVNVNVCPRCGTVDGDLTVDGIKFECHEERHDRFHGVVAANEYLRINRSYVRSVGLLVRDIGRVLVGGGK